MSLAFESDPRSAAKVAPKTYEACWLLERSISEQDCERHSSSQNNKVACGRCASPFRVCIPCFRQNVPRHAQGRVNSKSGHCSFHDEHGPDVVRVYVPPQAVQIQKPVESYAPLDADYVAMFPSHVIEHAAREEYPKLKPRHKKLLRLSAEGVTNVNRLALELDSSENTIYIIMNRLLARFSVTLPSELGSRDRAKARVTVFSLIHQRATAA